MSPSPNEVKDLIQKLNAQHPTVWTKGAAYDAINPATGTPVKIRRSNGVGTGIPFLHIYVPTTLVIKSPDGEVLSRRPSQRHYRANLRTYTIEEI